MDTALFTHLMPVPSPRGLPYYSFRLLQAGTRCLIRISRTRISPACQRLPPLSLSRKHSRHIFTQILPLSSSAAWPPVSCTTPVGICNTSKRELIILCQPRLTATFLEDGTTIIQLRCPDQKPLFSIGLVSHLPPRPAHSTLSEYLLHSSQSCFNVPALLIHLHIP